MLIELIEHTEARTKREAILTAIEEYNRKKKIAALADVVGRVEDWRADGRVRWKIQPLSRWSAVRLP